MAVFSTGLLGFQQSADDYYKNLANDAMMQGQQAETDRQNAQQYAQLAASLPLYDPTNLDYARQLVAAKVGYEQAADAAEQARHHENAEIVRREGLHLLDDVSPLGDNGKKGVDVLPIDELQQFLRQHEIPLPKRPRLGRRLILMLTHSRCLPAPAGRAPSVPSSWPASKHPEAP